MVGINSMKKPRTIVVGNGPSITGRGLGEYIDSFENVVRINNFKTEGFEKDVGTKTDVWATTLYVDIDRSRLKTVEVTDFFLPSNTAPLTKGWAAALKMLKTVGKERGIGVLMPSFENIKELRRDLAGNRSSSGTSILSHYIETEGSVAAVGFDFFASSEGHHYFNTKEKRSKYCPHRGWLERDWFFDKVANNLIQRVDVEDLGDKLIEKYAEIHKKSEGYGNFNAVHGKAVEWALGRKLKTVLDFGCGKGALVKKLNERGVDCSGYDPAIPERSQYPEKTFEGVCSTDVLEHIPVEDIPDILQKIFSLSEKTVFLNISTRVSSYTFEDGRNLHETVCCAQWWRERIEENLGEFKISHDKINHDHYIVVIVKE